MSLFTTRLIAWEGTIWLTGPYIGSNPPFLKSKKEIPGRGMIVLGSEVPEEPSLPDFETYHPSRNDINMFGYYQVLSI